MFEPRAQIRNSRRRDDGEFVAPLIRGDAEDRPQNHAGIRIGGRSSAASLNHLLGVLQEFRDVEPHHGGGNHTEIGKRGIASSNTWHAKKNLAEFVGFRHLLHLGARISNRDEAVAGFLLAHLGFDSFEEILFVDIRFQRAPRFAGDDANRAPEIHFRFDSFDLRGVGGVQHVQLGKSLDFPKGHAQNFRTQAGAAHTEQQRVFETRLLHVRSNPLQNFEMRELLLRDGEPAKPIALVRSRPEGSILLPETHYFIVFFPVLYGCGNRTRERAG